MERRTLVALLLCFLIIVFYPYVLRIFYPNYGKPTPSPSAVVSEAPAPAPAPSESAPAFKMQQTEPVPTQPAADETLDLEAGPYRMVLSKNAGSVLTLSFEEFKNYQENTPLAFMKAQHGLWGTGAIRLVLNGKEFDLAGLKTQTARRSMQASFANEDFAISKQILFPKSGYGSELRLEYSNLTDETQNIQLQLIIGSGLQPKNTIDRQYFESNWIGTKEVKHFKKPREDERKMSEESYIATSLKDRHFSSIVKPSGEVAYLSGVQGLQENDFASFLVSPVIAVPPQSSWSDSFLLYIGPNAVTELKAYGLDQIVNFGKLDPLCKLLLGGMQLVYGVVRNYGIAIILLTICINLLLLPLTRASLMSMKRMQLVQPQMTKIREKYKSDATRMNKEMMELYKKHKVNPMGGCLPMLLQMPIFISLYVALSKSFELLGSNLLWIKDLASPDNVPLPFELPLVGNTLHVLPLVMVVAMVFQQRASQARMPVTDPNVVRQQRMMGTMMPILFGFIFYPMPSGLVLYWLTNTLFMMGFQTLFMRSEIQ